MMMPLWQWGIVLVFTVGLSLWASHKRRKPAPKPRPSPIEHITVPPAASTREPPQDVPAHRYITLPQANFDDFIGQRRQIQRLRAAIAVAQQTGSVPGHMAFISDAGMGKTTLAACCATALNRNAVATVGSAIQNMKDVEEMIQHIDGGILFIDEAHDLARSDVPIISGLLPLLEEWIMHTGERSYRVKPFTCIMATTSFGMLDRALRSRMGIPYEFSPYTKEEMCQIVRVHARKLGIEINNDSAELISQRSRNNPRMARNILVECQQIALSTGQAITPTICYDTFAILDIDDHGLGTSDRNLLTFLAGGPASLTRCAGHLGMDRKTFEETVEHYLSKAGYITTSSRGRMLTEKGTQYLNARTNTTE